MFFESVFQELDGAYAPNTLINYRNDITRLCEWMRTNGLRPERMTHVELILYLENGCAEYRMATIRRAIAAIGTIYKYAELPDPTKNPKVTLAMRRIARQRGSLQSQAKPLTKELCDRLLILCDPRTTIGLRNRVLLTLGYQTMRRRSELVNFCFSDLRVSASGKCGLLLRSSKTDQAGHGQIIPISDELVELIKSWQSFTGSGFILRGVKKGGEIADSLAPESVNRILKRLESRLGSNQPTLSGHSFRIGKTVDMIERGFSVEQIALAGGWTSTKTVLRYAQSWTQEL